MELILDDLFANIGFTFQELLKAISTVIDDLKSDNTIQFLTKFIDNVQGSDLDEYGKLFNLRRLNTDTDKIFRDRIKYFIFAIQERSISRQGITNLGEIVFGMTPDLKEYPEYDFTSRTGKAYPGLLIGYQTGGDFIESDYFTFKDLVILHKTAGIPYFFQVINNLLFDSVDLITDEILYFGTTYLLESIFLSPPDPFNGEDWEANNFNNWDAIGGAVGNPSIKTTIYHKHSGTYGCELAYYSGGLYYKCFIEQNVEIPVTLFISLSWWHLLWNNGIRVTITYSDTTTYSVDKNEGTAYVWTQYFIYQSALDITKTITKIRFELINNGSNTAGLDDIIVNTVSEKIIDEIDFKMGLFESFTNITEQMYALGVYNLSENYLGTLLDSIALNMKFPIVTVPPTILINTNFETGNFTGWDYSNASVSVGNPHSGSYSAKMNVLNAYFEQSFTWIINISELTTFYYWYYVQGGLLLAELTVTVYYTDGTNSQFIHNQITGPYNQWVQYTPSLTAGKNLKKIQFKQTNAGFGSAEVYVDDITITVSTDRIRAKDELNSLKSGFSESILGSNSNTNVHKICIKVGADSIIGNPLYITGGADILEIGDTYT